MSAAAVDSKALELTLPSHFEYRGPTYEVDQRVRSLVSALVWIGLFNERREPLLFATVLLPFILQETYAPLSFPSEKQENALSIE